MDAYAKASQDRYLSILLFRSKSLARASRPRGGFSKNTFFGCAQYPEPSGLSQVHHRLHYKYRHEIPREQLQAFAAQQEGHHNFEGKSAGLSALQGL